MRVVAFESRRAAEMAELVRRQSGQPFVAPAIREAPAEDNAAAFAFAERLIAGDFDTVILLTGIGTRQMNGLLAARYPEGAFTDALRRVTLVARGPKAVAALRELGLKPAIVAPEPNTWHEVLAAMAGHAGRSIAVQEYGRPNPELIAALAALGAEVTAVRVYRYDLPENVGPLQEAARGLAANEFQAALFTTAVQIEHLARVAMELGIDEAMLKGLRQCLIGSIGPTTSEALEEFGVHPSLEPSHPKMGLLVMETAARAGGQTSRTAGL